jgi:hypothetical protein
MELYPKCVIVVSAALIVRFFWIPFFSDRKSLIGQKEESLHCTSGLDFAIGAKRFMTLLFERSES